ncbi:MAG: CDP-alcohol phosphatidyltransferase family protein [Ignavibacteriales bacterium]|nr:CDP-alcohol phosphatidyltransferase family protein [Ignavibacteriales bacterium]
MRILLAIPIFYFVSNLELIHGARWYLFTLYILVYFTDILDGYLARKFNQVSELGKIIDPLADKILVILVVIYLYYFNLIPAIYFGLLF